MKEQSFRITMAILFGHEQSHKRSPSAIDEQVTLTLLKEAGTGIFEVRELGPDETAECKVTMGADDLG